MAIVTYTGTLTTALHAASVTTLIVDKVLGCIGFEFDAVNDLTPLFYYDDAVANPGYAAETDAAILALTHIPAGIVVGGVITVVRVDITTMLAGETLFYRVNQYETASRLAKQEYKSGSYDKVTGDTFVDIPLVGNMTGVYDLHAWNVDQLIHTYDTLATGFAYDETIPFVVGPGRPEFSYRYQDGAATVFNNIAWANIVAGHAVPFLNVPETLYVEIEFQGAISIGVGPDTLYCTVMLDAVEQTGKLFGIQSFQNANNNTHANVNVHFTLAVPVGNHIISLEFKTATGKNYTMDGVNHYNFLKIFEVEKSHL